MGKDSKIPWTDNTFNCFWGCTKVSPACDNCYAETFSRRFGDWWGGNKPRRFFGDKHWNEPLKWNKAAEKAGVRHRVFCGSMCDVFEDRRDLDTSRTRLFQLILDTPHLDWLLLTKRIEQARYWLAEAPWYDGSTPIPNIWLGATVENQEYAERRIPVLLEIPAAVHFVSIEPILGPIDLEVGGGLSAWIEDLDWVIVGDESGHRRRPAELDWVCDIRDQCRDAGVAFFFKQWHDEVYGKTETPELDGVRHTEFPEGIR